MDDNFSMCFVRMEFSIEHNIYLGVLFCSKAYCLLK